MQFCLPSLRSHQNSSTIWPARRTVFLLVNTTEKEAPRRLLPTMAEIHAVNQSFGFYGRVGLFSLATLAVVSLLGFLWKMNQYALIEVPITGGVLVEGVIGIPRFINPVLAASDADRDLTALVYSGLMRVREDGSLEPDLAEKVTVSPDGTSYTFTLKKDEEWHDGEPVTADDVVFTVQKALDPSIKSPKRASWEGVTVAKIDTYTVEFTLRQPYASFLENTTMGILPKHKWTGVDAEQFPFSEYNVVPIGSGPYQVASVVRDDNSIPTSYELVPAQRAVHDDAKIAITIRFYGKSEDLIAAYEKGDIESMGAVSPDVARALAERGVSVRTAPLPRIFGVFVNQSEAPIFTHTEVREALSLVAPRTRIVDEVLYGYGVAIDGPIPPGSLGYASSSAVNTVQVREAEELLEKNGWVLGANGVRAKTSKSGTETLEFTLDTSNVPELKASAELLKEAWESIGISVRTQYYEESDLKNLVIRPRKYDALLFGEVVGRNPDPFSFWHSSQRLDPGLNIALYTNASVDTLLEKARGISDNSERSKKIEEFQTIIRGETPTIFLYAPQFIYVIPDSLKGVALPPITTPSDRFSRVNEWHYASDRVWKIFANYYN